MSSCWRRPLSSNNCSFESLSSPLWHSCVFTAEPQDGCWSLVIRFDEALKVAWMVVPPHSGKWTEVRFCGMWWCGKKSLFCGGDDDNVVVDNECHGCCCAPRKSSQFWKILVVVTQTIAVFWQGGMLFQETIEWQELTKASFQVTIEKLIVGWWWSVVIVVVPFLVLVGVPFASRSCCCCFFGPKSE